MGLSCCFFVCLVIFNWMPDIVNFTLRGAGYFSIPINIIVLCFRMLLSYLERVWSFLILPLNFVRWHQSNIYIRANFIPLLNTLQKTFLNTQPIVPWIMIFSALASGDKNYSWSCVSSENCSSNPFRRFFPQLGQFSHAQFSHALIQTASLSLGTLCRSPELSLHAAFSSLLLCAVNFSPLPHCKLCLLHSGSLLKSTRVLLPCIAAWKLSLGRKL